nr:hypothetical protein [Tanacetum cinerariifolium]
MSSALTYYFGVTVLTSTFEKFCTFGVLWAELNKTGILPKEKDTTRWCGIPSTSLDGVTRKSQPLPEGITTDPKDLEGNVQPMDKGLPFMVSDEGTVKTTPCPEGPCGDKDSEGLKPPADMEPLTNHVVDPSGTDTKY